MVSERIKAIRERINQREKNTRANRQAKARRIEKGDPDNRREAAAVKKREVTDEAKMSAEEARKLAADAKQLIATETGVSTSESESVIKQGSGLLSDIGDSIDDLDFDGDGDTDILTAVDPIESSGGSGISAANTDSKSQAVGAVRSDESRPMEFGEDEMGSEMEDPASPIMSFDDLNEI